VNHAIEAYGLRAMLNLALKWRHLPLVVKRHPDLRDLYTLRVFWRRRHLLLALGVVGVAAGVSAPPARALALPYARDVLRRHGTNPRGRLRALTEAPGKVAVDVVELAALAWGSARHRTLFL
jgi:hypothetical protein